MRENPWRQAFDRYLEHRRRRRLSTERIQVDRCTLRRLAVFCRRARIQGPQALTPQKFEAFVRYLQTEYRSPRRARPLHPSTVLDTVVCIRGLLAFLVREGDLLLDPSQGFRLQREPRRIVMERAVRPDEMKALVARLRKDDSLSVLRNRALLEVLFGCGLRRAEVVGLDLGDVDLPAGVVRVRHAKGGRQRLVPVTGAARRALRHYLDEARPQLVTASSGLALFLTVHGGRRLGKGALHCMVREVARKTGQTRRLTAHMFRHGYATALIRGGASVRVVQVLLGHRHISTTQTYTAVDVDDLQRVHARTHPREKNP